MITERFKNGLFLFIVRFFTARLPCFAFLEERGFLFLAVEDVFFSEGIKFNTVRLICRNYTCISFNYLYRQSDKYYFFF